MYHKFISFYVTCINYRNVVSHINYCNDVLRQPEFAGWNSLLIQKLAVRLTQQSHEGMRVRQIILLVSLLDYDALIKKCMIINCENYSRGKRALVPKIEKTKATRRIMQLQEHLKYGFLKTTYHRPPTNLPADHGPNNMKKFLMKKCEVIL